MKVTVSATQAFDNLVVKSVSAMKPIVTVLMSLLLCIVVSFQHDRIKSRTFEIMLPMRDGGILMKLVGKTYNYLISIVSETAYKGCIPQKFYRG